MDPTVAKQSGRPSKPLRLEKYRARYPELGPLEELPLPLIAAEYRARLLAGDKPSKADYRGRFPQHRETMMELLDQVERAQRKPSSFFRANWTSLSKYRCEMRSAALGRLLA